LLTGSIGGFFRRVVEGVEFCWVDWGKGGLHRSKILSGWVAVSPTGSRALVERATRIELASSAWKAEVLAIELRPQVWSG
tara:strand:+ start:130 stop:369 length:240 start_codon:yes stop_codon:yes gene_type:complete